MLKSCIRLLTKGIICFYIVSQTLYAQHTISKYEYKWVIFHPIAAFKIRCYLPKAMMVYAHVKNQKILDTLDFGGKLDAFRHIYVMAYLSGFVKIKKLKKLGIAHEKGNKLQFYKNKSEFGERADSLSCAMDLHNNNLGFEIGKQFNKKSNKELLITVINIINEGKALYFKRNAANAYLTCTNEVINMNFFTKCWYVPKCLITSNL